MLKWTLLIYSSNHLDSKWHGAGLGQDYLLCAYSPSDGVGVLRSWRRAANNF